MSYPYFTQEIKNGVAHCFETGDNEEFEHSLSYALIDMYFVVGSDGSDISIFYGSRTDIEAQLKSLMEEVHTNTFIKLMNVPLYFIQYNPEGSDNSVLITNWNTTDVGWMKRVENLSMFYAGAHNSDIELTDVFASIMDSVKESRGMKKFKSVQDNSMIDEYFNTRERMVEDGYFDADIENNILKDEINKHNPLDIIIHSVQALKSISEVFVGTESEEQNSYIIPFMECYSEFAKRTKQIQEIEKYVGNVHHCHMECTVGTANKYYTMDYAENDQTVDIKSGRIEYGEPLLQEKPAATKEEATKVILDKCIKKIKSGGYELKVLL